MQRANPAKEVTAAEYTLDRVLEERSKELIGEGHRFFDIRRWCDAPVEESVPMYGCNIYISKEDPAGFHTPVETTSMPTMFSTKNVLWPIHHYIINGTC